MINYLKIKNFGIFDEFEWGNHGRINILVGENGTGKTSLLNVIHATVWGSESYGLFDDDSLTQQVWVDRFTKSLRESFKYHRLPGVDLDKELLSKLLKVGKTELNIEAEFGNHDCHFTFNSQTNTIDSQLKEICEGGRGRVNYRSFYFPDSSTTKMGIKGLCNFVVRLHDEEKRIITVVIDNFEAGLHPQRIIDYCNAVFKAVTISSDSCLARNIQFYISTHYEVLKQF